jgi:hypothetical protein
MNFSETFFAKKHNNRLCFFIDTTGSMGNWITPLNNTIPQFIRISALTGAFTKICVVSYKDYDHSVIVTSTGWCDPSDPVLINFSKELQATGGGGVDVDHRDDPAHEEGAGSGRPS